MKILFFSHFIPHPPTGGASLRNFNIVKELGRNNELHLLTFTQTNRHATREKIQRSRDFLSPFCRDITILDVPTDLSRLKWYSLLAFNTLSRDPYSAWRFWSREMVQALNATLDRHKFDIIHVDTIALAGYLRYMRGLPAILNHHNVESTLLLRRAATERNPATKLYIARQGRKLRRAETLAIGKYDGNIAVSDLDREELLGYCPHADVTVIPNGTDTDFFAPVAGIEPDNSLVFAGSMGWYPNADAMILFARDIWPIIKREVPGIVMNLIGSAAPPEVLRVGASDPQFKCLGFVDDVRPYITAASVYVVPIRVGGGTRLKILDAMAMAKAIVSHPIGAEGLIVQDGKDIVIAEDPAFFAEQVIALLRDETRRQVLAQEARQTAINRYSWGRIVPRLEDYYARIAARRKTVGK